MTKLNFLSMIGNIVPFPKKPVAPKALATMPTRSDTVPGPGSFKPATVAVREFLVQMVEYGGGGKLQWKRMAHSYNQLRVQHSWPPISDQVLGQFLIAMGCTRRRERHPKAGRVIVYTLPLEVVDDIAEAS